MNIYARAGGTGLAPAIFPALPSPLTHSDFSFQIRLEGKPRRRLVVGGDAGTSVLAELAGRRRISTIEDRSRGKNRANRLACRDLALCDQLHCADGTRCPKLHRRGPVAAVMIDPDGTLMDSSEQRRCGLAAALAQLKDGRALPERIEFFTRNVYRRHELFQATIPDFPDLRQQWNHPAWYITYLMLSQDNALQQKTERWSLKGVAAAKAEGAAEAQCRQLVYSLQDFKAAYGRIEAADKESIAAAMAAFEQVRLYPFKEWARLSGVPAIDRGVRDVRGIGGRSGHAVDETRRHSGLSPRFFDREHVLTTGDAVQTVEVLRALQEEAERLAVDAADIRARRERLAESMDQRAM